MSLWRTDSPPLSLLQRRGFILTWVVVAASRLLAVARTPWDWDEMLFMLALRDYDVGAHHPHPPGFPLFIGAAKLVRLLVGDDFRALQSLSIIASLLIVPAMFLMSRELAMPFRTALSASIILAFLPNVWLFGGTAFSDVPSMVASLFAVALLLRGCRHARSGTAGAILLGLAIGMRPQNALIGALPMFLLFRCNVRRALAALLVVMVIVAASYGVAIYLTGWDSFQRAGDAHRRYIVVTDSFLSTSRPALFRIADDFFFRPFRQPILNTVLVLLAAAGVWRRRREAAVVLGTFIPFALFAWLFLDHHSASRFSIAWMPLVALFVAAGIEVFPRARGAIEAALVAGVSLWMWSGLTEVRTTTAPPVAAMQWIAAAGSPGQTLVYADRPLIAFADYYLPQYTTLEARPALPPSWTSHRAAIHVGEGGGQTTFARQREPLWNVARRRYFETGVTPVRSRVQYGAGWLEWEGTSRWMARRSATQLPAAPGRARLFVSLHTPRAGVRITFRINGATVDESVSGGRYLDRAFDVAARADAPDELVIETEPPERVRLERLEWGGLRVD